MARQQLSDTTTTLGGLRAITQPDGVAHPGITAYRDADGNLVLRLTPDAAETLGYYIDDIGPGYELAQSPGTYGVSDADAERANAVRLAVSNAIN